MLAKKHITTTSLSNLIIIAFVCFISIMPSVDAKTKQPVKEERQEDTLQLIILLDKIENTDKLVFDAKTLSQELKDQDPILKDTKDVEFLIKNRRQIGVQQDLRGLTPEELEKLQPSPPDMSLVHPKSTQGILQRYVITTYADKKTLLEAKYSLSKTKKVKKVIENSKGKFLSAPNDPFYISGGQWGIDAP